jgi:hypothetical protein
MGNRADGKEHFAHKKSAETRLRSLRALLSTTRFAALTPRE